MLNLTFEFKHNTKSLYGETNGSHSSTEKKRKNQPAQLILENNILKHSDVKMHAIFTVTPARSLCGFLKKITASSTYTDIC